MDYSFHLKSYETNRERLRSLTVNLTQGVAECPASKGGWTPAQVIAHIAIADQFYLHAMERGAESGLSGAPTRSPLIVIGTFLMNRAIPVPAPKEMEPPVAMQMSVAITTYDRIGAQMLDWLHSVQEPTTGVIAHIPQLGGNVSAHQLLSMLDSHVRYHSIRLERYLPG